MYREKIILQQNLDLEFPFSPVPWSSSAFFEIMS